MNNFFVIVFMIAFTVDGATENALIQYSGTKHFHDTKEQCEEYAWSIGTEVVIDEFLKTVNPEMRVTIESSMHCTPYNIRTRTYPDYPEFNLPPGEIPEYQEL